MFRRVVYGYFLSTVNKVQPPQETARCLFSLSLIRWRCKLLTIAIAFAEDRNVPLVSFLWWHIRSLAPDWDKFCIVRNFQAKLSREIPLTALRDLPTAAYYEKQTSIFITFTFICGLHFLALVALHLTVEEIVARFARISVRNVSKLSLAFRSYLC